MNKIYESFIGALFLGNGDGLALGEDGRLLESQLPEVIGGGGASLEETTESSEES